MMIPTQQILINASAHKMPLPAGFFHSAVTSPPYYALRKYQGAQAVDWPEVTYYPAPGLDAVTTPAERAALGLENTPAAYIGHLVLVFREVARVLRDDGIVWLNLGDSYGGGNGPDRTIDNIPNARKVGQARAIARNGQRPSDLMLIPHRVALALQGDGWMVRNDTVWAKKAPMPESVGGWRWERCRVKVAPGRPPRQAEHIPDKGQRPGGNRGNLWCDVLNQPNVTWQACPGCEKCALHGGYVLRRGSWRHTRAHEYIFMLVKGMGYFADQEKSRVPWADDRQGRAGGKQERISNRGGRADRFTTPNGIDPSANGGKNPRSVFHLAGAGYSGAHYAVFPPDLIAPLIRASTPARACATCGAPWAPVVDLEFVPQRTITTNTHGYRPTYNPACPGHGLDPVPGWCLDPFVGSGTTLEVCQTLGVNGVGLDLSPGYLDQDAKPRIGQTPAGALKTLPLFQGLDM